MNYAIMVAIGIVIGIAASFTGLGGGFIMVPLLIFLGFTAQRAVGTSFMAILIISTSALFSHGKLNHVDYRLGILIGLGGVVGAQIGSRLVQYVSNGVFNKVFAIILVALAARMFFQK
ncbi:sulfite exporter TauE/SafE family protein [Pelotomaculum propionicicum]|uniref:Probable membrane transporter protein n=1 Tax=Pelotomaculum propionicicum TaxID=258475 RepID=A0A4Y7RPJ0_9FIRM|nr:sulfite exporter TauE/SafE family protein [Pelotomaculum propionicicum]NLI12779.1 sulfite exporter TauE/SafE family protein [Peptococcaceae bacterium]TEB10592.1 hypothetical protein Pmgp_02282 [Pelotomaculum propionicicum]